MAIHPRPSFCTTNLPMLVQVAMPEEAAPLVDANWRVYQLRKAEKELGIVFPDSVMKRGDHRIYEASPLPENKLPALSTTSAQEEETGKTLFWPTPAHVIAGISCFPISLSTSSPLPTTSSSSSPLVAISGVGLVNATYTASILTHRFGVEGIISGGTAGGLSPDRGVGQIVAGKNYFLHQADATIFNYQPGQVPGMPVSYPAHPEWLKLAKTVAEELSWPEFTIGDLVSGDAFITSKNVDQIRVRYPQALAADMESAALAQTSWLSGNNNSFEAPFLSLRCISDLCSPDGANVFHINVNLAAAISAAFIVEMILLAEG